MKDILIPLIGAPIIMLVIVYLAIVPGWYLFGNEWFEPYTQTQIDCIYKGECTQGIPPENHTSAHGGGIMYQQKLAQALVAAGLPHKKATSGSVEEVFFIHDGILRPVLIHLPYSDMKTPEDKVAWHEQLDAFRKWWVKQPNSFGIAYYGEEEGWAYEFYDEQGNFTSVTGKTEQVCVLKIVEGE